MDEFLDARFLDHGLVLELYGGAEPAIVVVQGLGLGCVRVELSYVKDLVAELVDAAADMVDMVAGIGGETDGLV